MGMAHNELLQGYVYGGLLGLTSMIAIILGTGYVAGEADLPMDERWSRSPPVPRSSSAPRSSRRG